MSEDNKIENNKINNNNSNTSNNNNTNDNDIEMNDKSSDNNNDTTNNGNNDDDGWDDDGDGGWDDDDNKEDDGWGDPIESNDIIIPNKPIERTKSLQVVGIDVDKLDEAIQQKIDQIKEELYIEEDFKALLLLRLFKWSEAKLTEKYFDDQDKLLEEAGWCNNPKEPKIKSGKIECQVCFDEVKIANVYSLKCGHQTTCKSCWLDYLRDAVRSKQCITLPCPAYKCNVVIPPPVWKEFLLPKYKDEYNRYIRFSRENFVENSKEFTFCPGKNCDRVYSSQAGVAKEVHCDKCNYRFCYACKFQSHFPSGCHIAEKWIHKCSNESENLQWILAKTKRCPKCKVHIEKNQGCNHMTCRKHVGGCGYEFCWLCKGDWKEHGSSTGGYYKCNIYESDKKSGKISEEEKASNDAKNELERYEFHWTRYDSHSKSSIHGIKQLSSTHDRMHEFAQKFNMRLNETQFILDALNESIKCYHVLAWTYVIAYYFGKESKDQNLELFKNYQGRLETFCNGLQEKLDFDFDKLGDNKTRQEMIGFTRTAKQFRENLVEHIETEISF